MTDAQKLEAIRNLCAKHAGETYTREQRENIEMDGNAGAAFEAGTNHERADLADDAMAILGPAQ